MNAAENNPTQFGEVISQVDNGKKPVDRAYKEIKDELWRAQQLADTAELTNSFLASKDQCQLLEGDFREMSKIIANDSIDLIFTDPPYKDENIWMYEPLGEIAARVLKIGGSLICYINQLKLFEIGNMLLKGSGLKHWGIFYVALQGPFPRLYDHQFTVKIKAALMVC